MSSPNDLSDTPCTYAQGGWNPNTALVIDNKGVSLWGNYPAAIQSYAINMATQIMWTSTGRIFNLCDMTVRPCWNPVMPTYQTYPSVWNAGQYGGAYGWGLFSGVFGYGVLGGFCGCGVGGGACNCTPPQIELPTPVYQVLSVTENGAVLPNSSWRMDDEFLVRTDGQAWNYRQDLTQPLTATNTWAVRYLRGIPVPTNLNDAAGILAGEYAKLRMGQACRLPNRLTSVTRQGVTAQYVSAQDMIKDGFTGILEVDQAIRSVNPRALTHPPRVYSLDAPNMRPVRY
jgi:hypothetical protein